jgi:hypothetical protein
MYGDKLSSGTIIFEILPLLGELYHFLKFSLNTWVKNVLIDGTHKADPTSMQDQSGGLYAWSRSRSSVDLFHFRAV